MPKPAANSYPAYYHNYISQVDAESVNEAINKYSREMISFFKSIPEEKSTYSYAAGKWTIKELLQHIIDSERVFAYRAMSIARMETAMLPGFNEDDYAATSKANDRNWDQMLQEFSMLRQSTDLLLVSFDEEQLERKGQANNNWINVNAIAFIIFGHIIHHKNVLLERYL